MKRIRIFFGQNWLLITITYLIVLYQNTISGYFHENINPYLIYTIEFESIVYFLGFAFLFFWITHISPKKTRIYLTIFFSALFVLSACSYGTDKWQYTYLCGSVLPGYSLYSVPLIYIMLKCILHCLVKRCYKKNDPHHHENISDRDKWSLDKPTNSSQDEYARKELSKKVSEMIRDTYDNDASCTIAIQGNWGSGKTSFMGMVQENISDNCISIFMNPWQLGEKLKSVPYVLKFIENSIVNEPQISKAIMNLRDSLVKDSDNILLKIIATLIPKNESSSTTELKDKIGYILNSRRKKLVVFCDDLDRMTKVEIEDFFKLLRGILDWGNTFFFVGMDPEKIKEILEEPPNSKYIDKFIQVPINLPPVTKVYFQNLMINQMDKIFNEDISKIRRTIYFDHSPLLSEIKSKREVILILNSLKLTYKLVGEELDALTFLKTYTLKHLYPKAYFYMAENTAYKILQLIDNKEYFENDFLNDGKKITSVEAKKEAQKTISSEELSFIIEILKTNSDSPNSIAIKEKYPIYFRWEIGEEIISNAELNTILSSTNLLEYQNILNVLNPKQLENLFHSQIPSNQNKLVLDKLKLQEFIYKLGEFSPPNKNDFYNLLLDRSFLAKHNLKFKDLIEGIAKAFDDNPYKKSLFLYIIGENLEPDKELHDHEQRLRLNYLFDNLKSLLKLNISAISRWQLKSIIEVTLSAHFALKSNKVQEVFNTVTELILKNKEYVLISFITNTPNKKDFFYISPNIYKYLKDTKFKSIEDLVVGSREGEILKSFFSNYKIHMEENKPDVYYHLGMKFNFDVISKEFWKINME